jgi:hypothetical protein
LERANRLGSSLAHLETKSFGKEKSLSDQVECKEDIHFSVQKNAYMPYGRPPSA